MIYNENNFLKTIKSLCLYLIMALVIVYLISFLYYSLNILLGATDIVGYSVVYIAVLYISLSKIANYAIRVFNLDSLIIFRTSTIILGIPILYLIVFNELNMMYESTNSILNYSNLVNEKQQIMNLQYTLSYISKTGIVELNLGYTVNYIYFIILGLAVCFPKGCFLLEGYTLQSKYAKVEIKCYVSMSSVKLNPSAITSKCTEINFNERYEYSKHNIYLIFYIDDNYYIVRRVRKIAKHLIFKNKYLKLKEL